MVVDDRITNDPDRLIGGSFRQVDRRTCPALKSRRRGGFFLAILVVFVIFLDVTGATSLGQALPALPISSIDAYQPLREKESKSSLTSHLGSTVGSRNEKVNKRRRHIRSHYRPGVENNKTRTCVTSLTILSGVGANRTESTGTLWISQTRIINSLSFKCFHPG